MQTLQNLPIIDIAVIALLVVTLVAVVLISLKKFPSKSKRLYYEIIESQSQSNINVNNVVELSLKYQLPISQIEAAIEAANNEDIEWFENNIK